MLSPPASWFISRSPFVKSASPLLLVYFTFGVDWEIPRASEGGVAAGLNVVFAADNVDGDHCVGTWRVNLCER